MSLPDPSAWTDEWIRSIKADAIEEFAELQKRLTRLRAYAMDEDDWDEHMRLLAALHNYAAELRRGQGAGIVR